MIKTSVIVPAYNSEKTIEKCLKSLVGQNYPKNSYEIIVVDDGSTDRTIEIIKKFKKVKLVKQKHSGPAKARNLGVKKSKGNIILFTDSDCIPNKNWIGRMVEPFKDKNVIGVQGTYKTYNNNKPIARFAGYEIEERHKKMIGEIDFISTFSAGYKKMVFKKVGGFDETFERASAEDTDLSFKINKIGGKMIQVPNAFVYTYHPESLVVFLKKKFWMGYWRVYMYNKHRKKTIRHSYTPKSVYLGIVLTWLAFLLLLTSLLNLLPTTLIVFPISLFVILTLGFFLKVFRKDKIVGVISPFIMFFRDFVTGLGIIYGLKTILNKGQ
jgi:cellulose synthase/poly-beta-1,6-N-acetylglucosamine synthase-like glycosyltransferase